MNVRNQLETLLLQNFKDAWEESRSKGISWAVHDTGESREAIIKDTDWQDLYMDRYADYFQGLMATVVFTVNDRGQLIKETEQ